MDDAVFIIPSVIHFAEKPTSYSPIRSIYTPETRAIQTMQGILSIRRFVPRSKIILVELGSSEQLPLKLGRNVDAYVYAGGNAAVRRIVDGVNKGHGEAVGLLAADKAARSFQAKYFFKLSGRYRLSSAFNLDRWMTIRGKLAAKKYNDRCVCTRLYGFSADFYGSWKSCIMKSIPDLRFGSAIENVMPKFVSIHHVETLGVDGNLAPFGTGVRE